ncbi:MAG: hypothetical protein CMN77_10025 [Spirochaetaceae bacterium]|nr:hypothetical protein [Spirochaetaceae bacterium]|tara:strand:+ start:5495 stop:6592 length:1098 start_codon:yes stop_codon:yes gene_type:complete
MPFWNEKRVQEFVSGLGQGVQGATLEEFLGFLAGLMLVVIIIVWLQRKSDTAKSNRARDRSRALFERELEERTLPPSAVQLMEDLAHAMEQAQRDFEIHRLFRDPSLFDRFAGILIEEQPDLRRPLRLLKPILGLGHGFSGMTQSTEELNPGHAISVQAEEDVSLEFQVLSNDSRSLRIISPSLIDAQLIPGSLVQISWEKNGVLHQCQCKIIKIDSSREPSTPGNTVAGNLESSPAPEQQERIDSRQIVIQLEHSEEVQRLHRRGFVRTPGTISAVLSGHNVLITNIGGGGFGTERIPESLYALDLEDSVLPCRIHLEDQWIECAVRFVKGSRAGFHFAFERIRPGDQDRIVHYVLTRQTSNGL